MEHSEGGGNQERRSQLPQHYLHHQQPEDHDQSLGGRLHQLPPGSQQSRSWISQQQQQQLYQDQQQGAGGIRHPFNPSQAQPADNAMNMSTGGPPIDSRRQNEYPTASMVAAAQQQQYLQHQQQKQYEAAVATAGGNPRLSSATHQQQYAQQLSYQQQLVMQQMALSRGGGTHHHPHLGSATQQPHQNLHHSMGIPQQQQRHPQAMNHPSVLGGAVGLPPPHVVHPSQNRLPQHNIQQQQGPYIQPRVGRLQADRPLIKLTVSLIDTYKCINDLYYHERDARRAARGADNTNSTKSQTDSNTNSQAVSQSQKQGGQSGPSSHGKGMNNNGWDDDNYDYIIRSGELFYNDRYRIKERIGKGSFGQVVRALDLERDVEVAIKIIKSKKPFLMQARTEIELLNHLNEKDTDDQHNIVRLLTSFMYRNHQCLVFEMLSLNLYELLKNTQFGGVSLNLIRKFAKQVLKALSFLAREDVDVIHCDLKPENILLRHPKKSGVKVIDFGSSCRSNRRMYSYIQSRFYRSPEVILGLPYAVSIDMWSLGCILAEMHTGEPLFSGSDQFDQMQKIVKLLGMVPDHMLEQSSDQHRLQFFERVVGPIGQVSWTIKQQNTSGSSRVGSASTSDATVQDFSSTSTPAAVVAPSENPARSLMEIISAETHRKKKYPPSETGNSPRNYELFVDLIHRMLTYDPRKRIKPEEALNHPFVIGST
mmetsp:Transcript_8237/g.20276  ORF Transcript_8237/g.20276 Transcript_8237/m.20276 type:complete len:707 (-) Transcript_8237:479-2599(-)